MVAVWAEVDAMLRVHGARPEVRAVLCAEATFRNPERLQRARRWRPTWDVPAGVQLWSRDGDALTLPRPLATDLRRLAPLCPIRDRRRTLDPVAFRWRGELRPEQKTACRTAFGSDSGVVVGPCGSGKTQMGLALVAAWRQPALWLVHTTDLARQALERAQSLFDLPPSAFGLIGDGKEHIGTHLTVATVQTLVRRDLRDLEPHFGTVVIDEAHHTPAATFLQVVQSIPARYRLGLTATPDRPDGLGPAMLAVLGPITGHLTTTALAAAGRVLVPSVRQIPTRFRWAYGGDYAALLSALCADADRNAQIAAAVAAEARRGHLCLVLTERVDHARALAAALEVAAPEIPSAVLTGEATARQRAATLDGLRSRALRVLFATKLADEGLDVPALDRLFLTTGGRAAGRVAQQVGRAMRTAEGKAPPVVFDFCDLRVGVLAAQARARVREVYVPLGATVRQERVPA